MAFSTLRDICFDCAAPRRVAHFWAAVLGYEVGEAPEHGGPDDSVPITPHEGGMRIWFNLVPEPKIAKNRVHIDINMPDDTTFEHLLALGATAIREIRGDDGALWWTVMADVEGNEFCAFPPKKMG